MVNLPDIDRLIRVALAVGVVFGLALGVAFSAAWPHLPAVRLVWP